MALRAIGSPRDNGYRVARSSLVPGQGQNEFMLSRVEYVMIHHAVTRRHSFAVYGTLCLMFYILKTWHSNNYLWMIYVVVP